MRGELRNIDCRVTTSIFRSPPLPFPLVFPPARFPFIFAKLPFWKLPSIVPEEDRVPRGTRNRSVTWNATHKEHSLDARLREGSRLGGPAKGTRRPVVAANRTRFLCRLNTLRSSLGMGSSLTHAYESKSRYLREFRK